MPSNLDRYKDDLRKLVTQGETMMDDGYLRDLEEKRTLKKKEKELKDKVHGSFERDYQKWYTEACALIRQVLPERLDEFEALYKGEGKRKEIKASTYNIQDWLNGVRAGVNRYTEEKVYEDFGIAFMRFYTQLEIVRSLKRRFESSLFEIKQLVQADLLDSELDAARELHKNGFLRGAGVLAGVVLESHLAQVCSNHAVANRKKNPTISDYNDLLKKNGVIDVPMWRFIQRLGDLRNLCGHKKKREPTEDEVAELIDGVDKTTKNLY